MAIGHKIIEFMRVAEIHITDSISISFSKYILSLFTNDPIILYFKPKDRNIILFKEILN